MELKITVEKVRKAAGTCPDGRRILQTLFPEAFERARVRFPIKMGQGIEVQPMFVIRARGAGNLSEQGLHLPSRFDWAIERDDEDELVLTAREKV